MKINREKNRTKVSKDGILGARLFSSLISAFASLFFVNLLRLKETIFVLLVVAILGFWIGRKEIFSFWVGEKVSFQGLCVYISAMCLSCIIILVLLTLEDPITNNPALVYRGIAIAVFIFVNIIGIPANGPIAHFASRNFERKRKRWN